jgi:hypothetical protein
MSVLHFSVSRAETEPVDIHHCLRRDSIPQYLLVEDGDTVSLDERRRRRSLSRWLTLARREDTEYLCVNTREWFGSNYLYHQNNPTVLLSVSATEK